MRQEKTRGLPTLVLVYATLVLICALGIAYGISEGMTALEIMGSGPEREQTVLDQRIANAREIKEALRRPLPPIEPLPPVTAKLANPSVANSARNSPSP